LRHRPLQTLRLIRKFSRYMTWRDIIKLILSPFRKKKMTEKPDLPEQMIEMGLKEPVRLSA